MKGKLIVFEGGEGSGKTTQIKRLFEWLSRAETAEARSLRRAFAGIKLTREPGGTALGTHIRQLLLNESLAVESPMASTAELLLYAADRAQHVEETLRPWLASGYCVLCDRFTDSTVAYQGYGRQLDLALIHQLNQIATGGLKSDLTLWLNVPFEVGLARMHQRGQADRIEQAGLAFHQRVSQGFADLARPEVGKLVSAYCSGPAEEIDGDRAEDEVAVCIQQVFQQKIAQWYPHLFTT